MRHAKRQQRAATWLCSSGHKSRDVTGIPAHAQLQPEEATWKYCSMPTRMAVNGVGPYTCTAAARGGHLAVLQYARQNGSAWSSSTCEAAARGGHLAVLQYAHQNGCAWGPRVCSAAAAHGNLSILKLLRKHGCPRNSCTSREAAMYNRLEMLKWSRQQQAPCPWWSHAYFPLNRHNICPSVLVFLRQQQAPLSASHLAQACAAATKMTCAFLSLRAALHDRTPNEVVLTFVSLAFS